VFTCPFCDVKTELDFDPARQQQKWAEFICPSCGVAQNNIIVIEQTTVQISTLFEG
jgi:rubredoxin